MRNIVIVTGVVLVVGFVGLIMLGLLFVGFRGELKTITAGDLVVSDGNVKVLGVPSMTSSMPQDVSITKKENGDTFVDMTFRSPSSVAKTTSVSTTVMHDPNDEIIKNVLMKVLLFVLLLFIPILVIGVVLWKATRSRGDAACSADEIRLMQDLHQGFMRMQERIASLETILTDRKREF